MSATVRIPTILRSYTGGANEVTVDGGTLAEVLESLESNHPGIRARVLDDAGALRRFVNIYVGDDDVRFIGGLEATVADGVVTLTGAVQSWAERDPIDRMRAFLENRGAAGQFFADADAEAADAAADLRARTVELGPPSIDKMFDHVYSDPHPLIAEQKAWHARYEASFEGGN